MIIKALLIGCALAGSLWLLRGQRRAGRLAMTRLIGLLMVLGWVVAVLSPDSVTRMAQLVGVGRGTDLVLYVAVVGFMFSSLLQQSRIREVEHRIAGLTRANAMLEQRIPAGLPEPVSRVP